MKTVRPSPFLTLLYCVCVVLHPCAVASSRRPTGGDVTAGPGKTTDRQAGSVPPLPGRVPRPWVRARLWPLRRLLRELGAGRRRVEEWVCSWEVTMSLAASWFPIYTDTTKGRSKGSECDKVWDTLAGSPPGGPDAKTWELGENFQVSTVSTVPPSGSH